MVDGTRDRARRAGNWLRSESGRAAVRTGATVAAAGAGVAATVWGISKLAALSAAAAATADDQRFLRPTTAPVRRLKQFSKRNIRNELQGERELVLGEVHFSRFAGRHIEIFDGVTINVTLLLRPLHAPFDATQVVAPRCHRKVVARDPGLDMIGSQLFRPQIGIVFDKSLKPVAVPLVRIRRTTALRPLQKGVDDRSKGLRTDGSGFRCRHELVIAVERFITIGPQIDLATVYLDVPDTTGLLEEWFRKVRHCEPSSRLRKQPRGDRKARFRPALASGASFIFRTTSRTGKVRFVVSVVRPTGFEPVTLGSEDRCAIQLRHGRVALNSVIVAACAITETES